MKLKFKNILLISMLAVAGIFSATAVAFNKQLNETPEAEKAQANYDSSLYIVGTDTNWGTNKIQLVESDGSSTDLGMKRNVSLTAGGIFRISNAAAGWDRNYGYDTNLQSSSQAYSCFDRYVKGNYLYTCNDGSVSGPQTTTSYGATEIKGSSSFTLYLKVTGSWWYSSNCYFGFKSFDNSTDSERTVYVGTKVSGNYGATNVVVRFDLVESVLSYGFEFLRVNSSGVTQGNAYKHKNLTTWNPTGSVKGDGAATMALFTTDTDNNIHIKTTGNYDIYLNSSGQIYINQAYNHIYRKAMFFKGSHFIGYTDLSTDNVIKGNKYTCSTSSTWPSGYTYGGTNYSFTGVYSSGNTSTGAYSGKITSTTPSGDITVYEVFHDAHQFTVTVKYVIDGVYNSQLDYSINNVTSGTDVTSLDNAALYGYNFDGWFRDSGCGTSASGDYIGGATTLYAKMTRDSSNKTYYVDVTSCVSKFSSLMYVHFFNKTGEVVNKSTTWPGILLTGISGISNLYSFTIPDDCTGFIIGLNNGNNYQQTVDITPSTEHNLYVITTNSGSEKQSGEWKDVIYYLEGDEVFTGDPDTAWKTSGDVVMHEPTTDNGNAAEVTGVKVNNSSKVKIVMLRGDSGSFADYWYGTLGASYAFCSNDGSSNIVFGADKGGTYSFYLKNGSVYIENDANKTNYGYIYFSSDENASDIEVTCQNSHGDTTFYDTRLSYVSDEVSSLTLTFNNIKGLHKVNLYNLRKNNTVYPITSVAFYEKNNDVTTTVTFTDDATGPVYYVKTGLTSNNKNANIAKEAAVAFDIDRAVQTATNGSVCNVEKPAAIALCTAYNNLSSKTNIEAATVETWARTVGDSGDDVAMTAIRYQLGNIAGGSFRMGSLGQISFSKLFGGEDNFSTVIIVIASSVALLSVTALSILVIRKRKSKEQ